MQYVYFPWSRLYCHIVKLAHILRTLNLIGCRLLFIEVVVLSIWVVVKLFTFFLQVDVHFSWVKIKALDHPFLTASSYCQLCTINRQCCLGSYFINLQIQFLYGFMLGQWKALLQIWRGIQNGPDFEKNIINPRNGFYFNWNDFIHRDFLLLGQS